jgi:hypothetical protein
MKHYTIQSLLRIHLESMRKKNSVTKFDNRRFDFTNERRAPSKVGQLFNAVESSCNKKVIRCEDRIVEVALAKDRDMERERDNTWLVKIVFPKGLIPSDS